jgi:ATP-dependent Lhr-like helicase
MSRRSEFGKINLDRLIDTYWKSPVFDETMNELFLEKLDTEKATEIFDKLNSGKIKQLEVDGLSPIGSLGFRNELRDVARPDRPEAEIFKIFKERLLGTKTRIVCMSCGEYSQAGYVKNMPEEPRCTKCSSKLIGVTRYADTEMQKIVKKRVDGTELTGEEQKKWEGVYQTSNLVIVYGKKAIFVLAGRGVGPVNATRILAKPNLSEEELLKNILKAEREFVKNKKYWS